LPRATSRSKQARDCSSNSLPSTVSATPSREWSSAFRRNGSPTWPTTRTPKLIVVGSRGRGRFKAAFLGSVSNSLVGVARCPVLIVPPAAAEAQ
jgi:nucleotide-binding universal stress UspA family protein